MAGSPTTRMRQLAKELRRLRDVAGKTQKEAAEYIELTESALSRIEQAHRRVKVSYVIALCQFYNVEPTLAAFLEQLAREAGQRGWWLRYGDTVPWWFRDYLGMETDAAEAWTYESGAFPALLQTEEYVRAVVPADDARRFTELRATRQRRLTDDEPLVLRAVLDESVLHRAIGGPDVMHKQIRHVIDMAQLPNVTIQVLPFSVGFHPGIKGSFTALRFFEMPTMDAVYVEHETNATYVEKPSDVEHYTTMFESITRLALDQARTESFLGEIGRRWSEC